MYYFMLPYQPLPCPRPRLSGGRGGAFNPASYTDYKAQCVAFLKTDWQCMKQVEALRNDGLLALPELALWARFHRKGRRSVDTDNLGKALCDILQDAGIVDNDRVFARLEFERYYGANNPRTVFCIERFKGA